MRRVMWCWCVVLLSVAATPLRAADRLRIVSTLPDYAWIAAQIGGDQVQVESIAKGYEDAHFVKAKPSFARLMSEAHLFLTTGLDLELWAPTLIDKSHNARIREGAPGYVSVSQGMTLLDVPKNPSRAAGDIHVYGNPHIHTDPLRGLVIAQNILAGLKRVDPGNAILYERNYQSFQQQMYEKLYGPELVGLVGGEQLTRLTWNGELERFLDSNQFNERPLRAYLGGWFKEAQCLKGKPVVGYHRNWTYFADRFGIRIVDYVEDKPGIPPSARHVVELIEKTRTLGVGAVVTANYYDRSAPDAIQQKTGAKVVVVPLSVGGTPEARTYFDLFDIWIRALKAVYADYP